MANYPTADPSFSAKASGQVIDASHINGAQDEIVAIGSALRGTLQHALTVGTGGATVSSGGLTVSTGNTVLGQGLSVAGPSTLGGDVAFRSLFTVPSASTTLSAGSTEFNDVTLPSTGVLIRISGNSTAIAVGGFKAGDADGRVIFVMNANPAQTLTLLNEGGNSASTCRLQLGGADKAIAAGAMAPLVYDNVTGRWRGST